MSGRSQECVADGCTGRAVGRRLCRAHYQAAWKAGGLGAHAKLPPRNPNPTICPPGHKHDGSLVCYNLHQCRCSPCSTHRMAAEERRRKDQAYGRYDSGLVDVEPVREHLLMLGEFGLGYKRVAALAGLGITPVRNVIWGRQDPGPRKGEMTKRIKRENAEKILSVKPDLSALAPGQLIPSRGVQRRIQALVARGWSQAKLSERVGMNGSNFGGLLQRDQVSVRTHRAVAALYDELWSTLPPKDAWRDSIAYSRSVRYARDRRWLPPLAWDDIDNDIEPPVQDDVGGIDEMAVELALIGERVRLTPEERRECVRRLHASRWSDTRIAETIHCAARTVLRIREELGLEAYEQNDLRDRGAA